jgi:uncharacterized protein (TIGR02996 family)
MLQLTDPTAIALYQTILDEPDSDEPRLVYADWLEETGVESNILRAEFIRIQCKIADLNCEKLGKKDCRSPNCPVCQERRLLQERESEIWITTHEDLALRQRMKTMIRDSVFPRGIAYVDCISIKHLSQFSFPTPSPSIVVYRCGFPDELLCNMRQLTDHAKELSQVPLRQVQISRRYPIEETKDSYYWIKEYPGCPDGDHFVDSKIWPFLTCPADSERCFYSNDEQAVSGLDKAALLYLRSLRFESEPSIHCLDPI